MLAQPSHCSTTCHCSGHRHLLTIHELCWIPCNCTWKLLSSPYQVLMLYQRPTSRNEGGPSYHCVILNPTNMEWKRPTQGSKLQLSMTCLLAMIIWTLSEWQMKSLYDVAVRPNTSWFARISMYANHRQMCSILNQGRKSASSDKADPIRPCLCISVGNYNRKPTYQAWGPKPIGRPICNGAVLCKISQGERWKMTWREASRNPDTNNE